MRHRSIGVVDPSMGGIGAYASYTPTMMGLGVEVQPPPPRPVDVAIVPHEAPSAAVVLYGLFTTLVTASLIYHGYKRNESVGWAIGWGLLGGIAPVIALPVAVAQGFGEKKKGLTPNRRRRRAKRRAHRQNPTAMREYEIMEDGFPFATIGARDAVSALRKATRQYPRRSSDYNLEPGETLKVTWRAWEPGDPVASTATVTVPGRSDRGCSFHGGSK